jgi:hypothetical protein
MLENAVQVDFVNVVRVCPSDFPQLDKCVESFGREDKRIRKPTGETGINP